MFALLLIQVRVAVVGCLVTGYLPASQKAEQVMKMEPGEPCTEQSTTDKPPCMKHCELSSNTPKSTFDLPLFAPIVFLTSVPMFLFADAGGFYSREQPSATAGPPIYLRFLRLLN